MKLFVATGLFLFLVHFLSAQASEKIIEKGLIILCKDSIENKELDKIISTESILNKESYNFINGDKNTIQILFMGRPTTEEIKICKSNLCKNEKITCVNTLWQIDQHGPFASLEEFYIKLKSEKDTVILNELAMETHCKIIKKHDFMKDVYILSADKNASGNAIEMAANFNETKYFEYASPNCLISISSNTVNDPYFTAQWALKNTAQQSYYTNNADMNVGEAWNITNGKANIKIAVIDVGVDTNHIDLQEQLLPGYDALNGITKGYPDVNNNEAHGTACAGIIAAKADNDIGIAGIANSCKVIPIRVYAGGESNYTTNTNALVNGISWAWQVGKADVISCSIGIDDEYLNLAILFLGLDTTVIADAIRQAAINGRDGKGLPIFFSAGNSYKSSTIWPSRLSEVIAVGATNMCDQLKSPDDCSSENWGSCYGKNLDVCAPGVEIYSTDLSGSNGYTNNDYTSLFNGTSAACPNAAGVMALVLSINGNLSLEEARLILESTCDKVGGYSYYNNLDQPNGTWSNELGYGRVNAFNAVEKTLSYTSKINSIDLNTKNLSWYSQMGKIYLSYILHNTANVTIELYDLTGKKVANYFRINLEKGTQCMSLNTEKFSNGIYIIKANIDEQVSYLKIAIQK